jgi:hypothetical protein
MCVVHAYSILCKIVEKEYNIFLRAITHEIGRAQPSGTR